MSILKDNLISILKQNDGGDYCLICDTEEFDCQGVKCSECPFFGSKALDELIAELKGEECKRDDVITEPF